MNFVSKKYSKNFINHFYHACIFVLTKITLTDFNRLLPKHEHDIARTMNNLTSKHSRTALSTVRYRCCPDFEQDKIKQNEFCLQKVVKELY